MWFEFVVVGDFWWLPCLTQLFVVFWSFLFWCSLTLVGLPMVDLLFCFECLRWSTCCPLVQTVTGFLDFGCPYLLIHHTSEANSSNLHAMGVYFTYKNCSWINFLLAVHTKQITKHAYIILSVRKYDTDRWIEMVSFIYLINITMNNKILLTSMLNWVK